MVVNGGGNGASSSREVCAILDKESSALSTIAVAVAALSCEAAKADVAPFDLADAGDGSIAKEDVAVAADLRILLNSSKLVGANSNGSECFAKIPVVIGNLREAVKGFHSVIRVVSNFEEKVSGKVLVLGWELLNLGESSRERAAVNIGFLDSDYSKTFFERDCPSVDNLRNGLSSAVEANLERKHGELVKEVSVVLGLVWKIVAWEAMTAFLVLEGGELAASPKDVEEAGVPKPEKKKKKKKKVVLGKGTGVIVEMIKDKLGTGSTGIGESSHLLGRWIEQILLLLDPKNLDFDSVLGKVKEILESNESRRIPKTPKGTRDFAKEQMVVRKKAFSIITKVFERHCATALDTPAFELKETLMGKYGEDSKLIYDLADQGGELCSLRYDLTVPFSRYVAMHGLTSFKRYHIDKVWRRDNPSKGRYREFYQCDFDIAGHYEKMGPDFEVVRILSEVLDALNIGDYEIKLNHRKLLDGVLEICGVPPGKFRTICSSIDKLDKQSFEQVKKEMVEEKGISVETADKIGTFVKIRGPPLELIARLTRGEEREGTELLKHSASKEALDDLLILFEALEKSKCINKVVFDLSLARGLDYYTGVIFEAVFKGGVQVGSIGAGGRYDNMIGNFGTKQVPAVGMSLGIERVLTIMEDKALNQATRASETQVLVAVLENKLPIAAELVSELWDANIKAEFKLHKKVMKHIEYAIELRIPWMVLVGERELSEGIVKLKNIETANEEPVPRNRWVDELKQRLNV